MPNIDSVIYIGLYMGEDKDRNKVLHWRGGKGEEQLFISK